MILFVNGKEYEFDEPLNISQLLEKLNITSRWVVIELNQEIINREDNNKTILKDKDKVEIVGFVGGG